MLGFATENIVLKWDNKVWTIENCKLTETEHIILAKTILYVFIKMFNIILCRNEFKLIFVGARIFFYPGLGLY